MEKNKKLDFIAPRMEVIAFTVKDIMMASGVTSGGFEIGTDRDDEMVGGGWVK